MTKNREGSEWEDRGEETSIECVPNEGRLYSPTGLIEGDKIHPTHCDDYQNIGSMIKWRNLDRNDHTADSVLGAQLHDRHRGVSNGY